MKNQKICLIGFMGSGKSTAGMALAKTLGWDFCDLDDYIEKKEGKSISDIFDSRGEAHFRELESQYLGELVNGQNDKIVISLGGGTPCNDRAWTLLEKCHTCYIKLSVERILDRLASENQHRPLIKDKSREEILDLINDKMKVRRSYYQRADHSFMGYLTPEQIVKNIMKRVIPDLKRK